MPPIPRQSLSHWQNAQSVVYQICARREPGLNYAELGARAQCSAQQHACKGYYGGQSLCIPKHHQCPINYLELNASNYIDNVANNSVTISYSRNLNRPPLTNLIVGLGNGICIDPQLQNIPTTFGYNNLTLFANQTQFCPKADDRYQLMGSLDLYTYYRINNLYANLSAISGYCNETSVNISAFTQYNVRWENRCREKLFQKAMSNYGIFDFIFVCDKWLMVTNLVYFFIVGILIPVLGCLKIQSFQKQPAILKINSCKLIYSNMFFTILQGSVVIISFWQSYKVYVFFKNSIQQKCTDSTTLELFANIYNLLDDTIYFYSMIIFVLFISYLVSNLILILFVYDFKAMPTEAGQPAQRGQ